MCVCKILQEKIIMQPILRKWTWTLLPHPTPPMWHDNKNDVSPGCEKTSKNMALQAVPCCVLGQGLEPVFFMNAAISRLEHRSSPDGQLDSEQQKCGISWGLKLHKWWISSAFNLQKWHFLNVDLPCSTYNAGFPGDPAKSENSSQTKPPALGLLFSSTLEG